MSLDVTLSLHKLLSFSQFTYYVFALAGQIIANLALDALIND